MPRRIHGEGSIYEDKARGQWVGAIDVGRRPDGTRIRAKVRAKSRKMVSDKLHDLRNREGGLPALGANPKVEDALNNWVDWAKRNKKTKTYEFYESQVRLHVPFTLKSKRLLQVDRNLALSVVNEIDRTEKTLSGKYKAYSTSRFAFQYFLNQGLIKFNPFASLGDATPKCPPIRGAGLSLSEEGAFLRIVSGHRFESLFVLALDCGARQGELFALTWADIDYSNTQVRIIKQVVEDRRGGRVLDLPKSARRTLEISNETMDLLVLHKSKCSRVNDSDLVFCDQNGGYLRKSNFTRRVFKTVVRECKSMGAKEFTFHALRHTCATNLLADGEYIQTVSARLGHSDVRTTLAYYAHTIATGQKSAALRFSQRYATSRN